MRTIAVINQKGGCGKTTSAINLAGLFARRGCRTLLIDMDPQAHCAAGLAIPEQRIDLDIGDAMLWDDHRPLDPARLLWRVARNLDLAPSRMRLAGLEAARGKLADRPDRELRLGRIVERFADSFDVGVIDCSPSIGLLTFNAMAAADAILVPVETSFFSLQGATKQISTVRSLCRRLGLNIPCWLVPTIHEPDSPLAKDLLAELRRRFGRKVAPVAIRRDWALKEAASFGQPVFEYAPASPGADDYAQLASWIARLLGVRFLEPDDRPRPLESTPASSDAPARDQSGDPSRTPPASPAEAMPPVITVTAGRDAKQALARRLSQAITTAKPNHAEPTPSQADAQTSPQSSPQTPAQPGPSPTRTRQTPPSPPFTQVTPPAPIQPAGPTRGGIDPALVPNDDPGHGSALVPASAMAAVAMAQIDAPVRPMSRAEDLARRAIALRRRLKGQGATVSLTDAASKAIAPSARRLLGATSTASGLLLVQPLSLGSRVCVAGVFNGWSGDSMPMRRNEILGVFELTIDLPQGVHAYRLIVDGRWTHDSFNERSAPNPFGELNSIAVVSDGSHPPNTRTPHDE